MKSAAVVVFASMLLSGLPAPARARGGQGQAPSQPFSIQRLVKIGDPAPGGGTFFYCGAIICEIALSGHHPLSDTGEISFFAPPLQPGCEGEGIYLADGKTITVVANSCIPTPFGNLQAQVGPANLNDHGLVVLLSFIPASPILLLWNGLQLSKAVEPDQTPFGAIRCGISEPFINNNGDVVFQTCAGDQEVNGVFEASQGQVRRLVKDGDLAPDGGSFFLDFLGFARINNNGDVLFLGGSARPTGQNVAGLFLYTAQGIKEIEVTGDVLPDGHIIKPRSDNGFGDLNDAGEVVFSIAFNKQSNPQGAVYVYLAGAIRRIAGSGDPTPIGGTILGFLSPNIVNVGGQYPGQFPIPAINASGTVLFRAQLSGTAASSALFLASSRSGAMLEVAAAGDRLPTGEVIKSFNTFALNNRGQVAFTAMGKNGLPLGVFLATPAQPSITSAALKTKAGVLQLTVDGSSFITKDSVILINGAPLQNLKYPAAFQQRGGTTTRIVSKDPNLGQLIPPGQSVQVTVANRLTGATSAAVSLSR